MTKARKLVRKGPIEPDAAELAEEVFGTAWKHIAPALQAQPPAIVAGARTLLASTIMDRVKIGLTHPGLLQDHAIGVVKGTYPQLPIDGTYLY